MTGRVRRCGGLAAAALVVAAVAAFLTGAAAYAQTPAEAPDLEVLWELMVLSRAPEGVQVAHLMYVVNMGPRVATAVPLSVPEGVRWLETPAGLLTEGSLAIDPEPLGVDEERRYMLIYEIPWQRLPMPVRRAILYPTHELQIWSRAGELTVRGVNVLAGGSADFEGVRVDTYAMLNLQPHPSWQIVLDSPSAAAGRLPDLSPVGHRSDPLEILRTHPLPKVMLGVVGLLVVIGAARRFWPASKGTGGSASAAAVPGTETAAAVRDDAAALKDEIVRLDVAFRNGELDETTYNDLRRQLKERLLAVLSAPEGARESGGERR